MWWWCAYMNVSDLQAVTAAAEERTATLSVWGQS